MVNSLTRTIIFSLLLVGCNTEHSSLTQVEDIISDIKETYAPDRRVARFDVEPEEVNQQLILRGESNLPKAVAELKEALTERDITFIDSIQLLPTEALEGKIFGVVKLSVANLRSAPQHSAELSTQALLGTPLNVLKKEGGWYLVQTPDKYISWIDWGGLQAMTDAEFQSWQASKKIIYLKPFGFSFEAASEDTATFADLVMGNILETVGKQGSFFQAKYPDGQVVYIPEGEALPYEDWLASLDPSGRTLVNTSFRLKGLPYLWGGTSFKGVDCSGFTKTVYFMNGLIIPRDASQQIHTGLLVDDSRSFDQLLPGDLLFFGRPATDSLAEKVVHVGMWIGNNEFIHASGKVHISSVDSTADNFDAYNYKRYLRTKRLLHKKDENLIQLSDSRLF